MATKKKAAKKSKKKASSKKKAPSKKKASSKKKATKKTAKKTVKKAAKPAAPPTRAALKKYRDKTVNRLDKINDSFLQAGEELFGAIDKARNRYTEQWEAMRRKQVSLQTAIWKVRPSRDSVEELMAGIDSELAELEAEWREMSKKVKRTINQLT